MDFAINNLVTKAFCLHGGSRRKWPCHQLVDSIIWLDTFPFSQNLIGHISLIPKSDWTHFPSPKIWLDTFPLSQNLIGHISLLPKVFTISYVHACQRVFSRWARWLSFKMAGNIKNVLVGINVRIRVNVKVRVSYYLRWHFSTLSGWQPSWNIPITYPLQLHA